MPLLEARLAGAYAAFLRIRCIPACLQSGIGLVARTVPDGTARLP